MKAGNCRGRIVHRNCSYLKIAAGIVVPRIFKVSLMGLFLRQCALSDAAKNVCISPVNRYLSSGPMSKANSP